MSKFSKYCTGSKQQWRQLCHAITFWGVLTQFVAHYAYYLKETLEK